MNPLQFSGSWQFRFTVAKPPPKLLSDVKSGSSFTDFELFSLITDLLGSIDCPKNTIKTFNLFLIISLGSDCWLSVSGH